MTFAAAQQRAVTFLISRSTAGVWRDYFMSDVESDEWMTAYVAHALAETGLDDPRVAAWQAWQKLKQMVLAPGAGLGYSTLASRDADSSAWGVRLADLIAESKTGLARGCLDSVRDHMRPEGGVGTYNAPDLLRARLSNSEAAVDGWIAPHLCVTGAAASVPEFAPKLCKYLSARQDEDGRWRSYWWSDDEYATALAIESLAANGAYSDAVGRAAGWLAKTNKKSSFVLALRAFGLRKADQRNWLAVAKELVNLQSEDGSWPASARMRMPPPELVDPRRRWCWDKQSTGIGCVMVDRHRLFTTATGLRALTACLNA